MYEHNGESIFVVDGHVHFWDGSPENYINRYGDGWIRCFYDYHKNLSPAEYVWPLELYQKYPEEQLMRDLFEEGYVDIGIFQPTYLKEFYKNGFNTLEQDAVLKEKYPGQVHPERPLGPAGWRGGPRAVRAGSPPLQAEGRQALHGGVEGRLQGLEAERPRGPAVPRQVRRIGRGEHPRPQGADDLAPQ
jgi:hypothetical protein